MYYSDCDNRPKEPNDMRKNTITVETYNILIANLITEIENTGLGICQPANDTVVTIQNQKIRRATILLRALADGFFYSCAFCLGTPNGVDGEVYMQN